MSNVNRFEKTDIATKSETSQSTSVELARLAFEKLADSGIGTLTKSLEATSKVAEKGVITFLLSTGVTLGFFCLALKIEIDGHKVGALSSGEFVTAFIVAGVIVLAGACLRAWTFNSEYALKKQALSAELQILVATAKISEKGLQAASEIATANADIAKTQITASAETSKAAVVEASKKADPAIKGNI